MFPSPQSHRRQNRQQQRDRPQAKCDSSPRFHPIRTRASAEPRIPPAPIAEHAAVRVMSARPLSVRRAESKRLERGLEAVINHHHPPAIPHEARAPVAHRIRHRVAGVDAIALKMLKTQMPIVAAHSTSDIAAARLSNRRFMSRRISLRLRPHARRLAIAEEFQMDHVGIAADRAIFHVLLLRSARCIQRNDNLLAARRADVPPLVPRPAAFFASLLHVDVRYPR